MLRSNYRCVELLNVSVEVAKCGKYSQIHPVDSLYIYYKKWPVLTEQSIHGKFQLIIMSSYANNKQQMCRVTQHQCIMSPNVENIHKFTQYTDYLSITKKKLSWLNNLFMVMFQLIRMSSYAKNKLQMCWVNEHQCRSRQMCKTFTNSPSTLTFCLLQKMTSLAWTIYSWWAYYS